MIKKIKKHHPDLLLATGFDDCIIGLTYRKKQLVVLYDGGAVVHKLAREMPFDEAQEFYEFNIVGAYVGAKTPVFHSRDGSLD